jgi:hypothetical protein
MSSSTATPESAMKPTPAEIEKGMSRSHKADDPTDPGKWNAREYAKRVHDVSVRQVQGSTNASVISSVASAQTKPSAHPR